jgi:hypothetical protein
MAIYGMHKFRPVTKLAESVLYWHNCHTFFGCFFTVQEGGVSVTVAFWASLKLEYNVAGWFVVVLFMRVTGTVRSITVDLKKSVGRAFDGLIRIRIGTSGELL